MPSVPATRVSVTQDPLDRFKSPSSSSDQITPPESAPGSRPISRVISPQSLPGSRYYSPQSSRPTSRVYPGQGGRNNRGSMPQMPSGHRLSMIQPPGTRVSMPPIGRTVSKSKISMPLENPLSRASMTPSQARAWQAQSQPQQPKQKKGWRQSLLGKFKKNKKEDEPPASVVRPPMPKMDSRRSTYSTNSRMSVGYTAPPEGLEIKRASDPWKAQRPRSTKSTEWRRGSKDSWHATRGSQYIVG
jgi:hypothetical protein